MLANNRYFGISAAARVSGFAPSQNALPLMQMLARQSGGYGKTVATPRGYGSRGLAWPARAGEIGADLDAFISLTASGSIVLGRLAAGSADISLTATGEVQAVAAVAGSASIDLTASGTMQGLAAVQGSASLSLTATGNVTATADVAGSAGMTLTASALLGATAAVAGTAYFSAAAEGNQLTEQGIVSAVWGASAAAFNSPGSMGAKLNTASSGGVDLDALATAVWAHTVRGLTQQVNADVRAVNGVTIKGTGVAGDTWGPV